MFGNRVFGQTGGGYMTEYSWAEETNARINED